MSNDPVLFQEKYDLNIKRVTKRIDPDRPGVRHEDEEHDVLEAARWAGLSVAIYTVSGVLRDVRSSREDTAQDAWDVRLTVDDSGREDVFTEIGGGTDDGRAFVARYLREALLSEECRGCGKELVGREAVRNRCLCEECEGADPLYFERLVAT